MKKSKKSIITKWLLGAGIVVLTAAGASATLITDDFTRATATAQPLADPWDQPDSNPFYTQSGDARTTTADTVVAWNTALETVSGAGEEFTYNLDVLVNTGRVIGAAFNVQDESNYYYVALQTGVNRYSYGKVTNGEIDNKLFNDATVTFAVNTLYHFKVTSDTVGSFDFEITQGGGPVLNPTTSFTDSSGTPFVGGYAGLFKNGIVATYYYDNFSLEQIPEPATLGLLGLATGALLLMRRLNR